MPLLMPMVFDEFTGKKVKTHTSQCKCEKQIYKANKRILRSLSFDNNVLMWPYDLIFSEYCKFFYILLRKLGPENFNYCIFG